VQRTLSQDSRARSTRSPCRCDTAGNGDGC
jgi:hypothetical protein